MPGKSVQPSYARLGADELRRRAESALARLSACDLCPRKCGVDRSAGEDGFCHAGRRAVVASYQLHYGEESVLVGRGGSGTVFFSGCNLGCVFCQNWDISHADADGCLEGIEASPEELAGVMLELQSQGAENINLVSPTHVAGQILEALPTALEHGLRLPLVWNSGGYESLETLALLDGVVDIFMPDAKVWDQDVAARILLARDYPETARAAIAEMHRQVGDLELDERGLARKGLLVRHLVLPEGLAGSGEWMHFLAGLSPLTFVNVMGQYRPCGRAGEFPPLDRPVRPGELATAQDAARRAGLTRLDDAPDALPARILRHIRSD